MASIPGTSSSSTLVIHEPPHIPNRSYGDFLDLHDEISFLIPGTLTREDIKRLTMHPLGIQPQSPSSSSSSSSIPPVVTPPQSSPSVTMNNKDITRNILSFLFYPTRNMVVNWKRLYSQEFSRFRMAPETLLLKHENELDSFSTVSKSWKWVIDEIHKKCSVILNIHNNISDHHSTYISGYIQELVKPCDIKWITKRHLPVFEREFHHPSDEEVYDCHRIEELISMLTVLKIERINTNIDGLGKYHGYEAVRFIKNQFELMNRRLDEQHQTINPNDVIHRGGVPIKWIGFDGDARDVEVDHEGGTNGDDHDTDGSGGGDDDDD